MSTTHYCGGLLCVPIVNSTIIAVQYHNEVSILFHENLTTCRLLYILAALQISQLDWQREASTTHYSNWLLEWMGSGQEFWPWSWSAKKHFVRVSLSRERDLCEELAFFEVSETCARNWLFWKGLTAFWPTRTRITGCTQSWIFWALPCSTTSTCQKVERSEFRTFLW